MTVRREGDRLVLLLRRRRIEVARRQVPRVAAARRDHEYVMTHPVAPFVPVPIQQSRQGVSLDRILLRGVLLTGVARFVRTGGRDIRHERERRPVGRKDHRRLDAGGELRDLPDVVAVRVREVDLRASTARGDERELFAVWRPAWRVLALVAANQQPRGRGTVGRDDPHVGVTLPGCGIRRRAHEGDAPAVRRDLRIRNPDRGEQIVNVHRPRGRSRIGHEQTPGAAYRANPRVPHHTPCLS